MMDVFDFFQGLGIDTKTHKSGSFYTKCPQCHDERKSKGTKELLVSTDKGYVECFHCGWKQHILKSKDFEKVDFTPPPPTPQKYISPEPIFNWIVPDAVIDPTPTMKPIRGKFWITWYFRNIHDKLTGAKKMEYEFHENGFNRTDSLPIHTHLRDSGYYPCIFYERDLYVFPHATVILLESEKTSAILRRKFRDYLKEFIFLGVGGANGLTDEKAKVLAGRNILIVYDCDNGEAQEDGTIKKPKGREGALSAHTKLAGIANSSVVDIVPGINDGTDLADIIEEVDIDYLRAMKGERKYPKELIEIIQNANRSGAFWNSSVADSIGTKLLIDHKKVYEIGRVYYEANKHEFGIDDAPILKKVEYFLLQRFEFRRNSITKKIVYRDLANKESQYTFCNYNDVWRLVQHHLPEFGKKVRVNITDISNLLESDFVPEINPFEDYFHSLAHWDGVDHISALANHIVTTDQPFWLTQFRKSLIRMIACTYGQIENRIIMVLVGPIQSQGKDSFIRFLVPPQLKEYYKEDPLTIGKDTEIALCQNISWNLTELDQLTKKEISEIKGIISRASVKQRRSYGRQEENMTRIVNFWGSTNKDEFLTDTQNTRWLCFRVEDISHRYNDYINNIREIDITKVWAQAWHLYKSGEQFNLNEQEREKRDIINHSFEYMSPEKSLIIKYLTPCPKDSPVGEFITVVDIQEYLIQQTDNKLRLAHENIGRSMTQLDFVPAMKKVNGKPVRGYFAMKQALLKGTRNIHASSEPVTQEMITEVPGASDLAEVPF